MFSLFKKGRDKSEVPKWASFFSKDEYQEFVKAIEQYFYAKNITYNWGDGILTVGPNDLGLSSPLGLVNVAQGTVIKTRVLKKTFSLNLHCERRHTAISTDAYLV
jgi:hypothetical protein